MTARLRQIIDRLKEIVTFVPDSTMSDDDFTANITAVNLLCNLHDDLGINRSHYTTQLPMLFPEFLRRIRSKDNIQAAFPLIRALHEFIYGREDDRGPAVWRNDLADMCREVVDEYRRNPLLHSSDYLYALSIICIKPGSHIALQTEYRDIINSYNGDIDRVDLTEKILRLGATDRFRTIFLSSNPRKWEELRAELANANTVVLDDTTFLKWCDITDQYPPTLLRNRAERSGMLYVEYLRALAIIEFELERRQWLADRQPNPASQCC